jgi:hypothetical protein
MPSDMTTALAPITGDCSNCGAICSAGSGSGSTDRPAGERVGWGTVPVSHR